MHWVQQQNADNGFERCVRFGLFQRRTSEHSIGLDCIILICTRREGRVCRTDIMSS